MTAEDPIGQYAPSEPVGVTLDSNHIGSADLVLTEKGSFILGELSGPEASLLVFDAGGSCICTGAPGRALPAILWTPAARTPTRWPCWRRAAFCAAFPTLASSTRWD